MNRDPRDGLTGSHLFFLPFLGFLTLSGAACVHAVKWKKWTRGAMSDTLNVNPGLINHGLIIGGGTPPIVISSDTFFMVPSQLVTAVNGVY